MPRDAGAVGAGGVAEREQAGAHLDLGGARDGQVADRGAGLDLAHGGAGEADRRGIGVGRPAHAASSGPYSSAAMPATPRRSG